MKRPSRLLVFTLLLSFGMAMADARSANYDESKAGVYKLPDPLVFNDGKPVRTSKDWRKRRGEILELFQENVYGRNPEPPRHLNFEVFDSDPNALGGKAFRKQISIYFSDNKDGPREDLLLYVPSGARKPVPVILTLNFRGNHSVIKDPGVRLGTVWDWKTHLPKPATESQRGIDKEFEVEKILSRGYAFATIYYQQIEPDFNGGFRHGIHTAFFKPGQTEPGPDEWGAIGAWSYGLSRAMDYLQKEKLVNVKRVAVMGHSRLGKTSLWAGALDTRFAMVISNCSGEGGASLARRNFGETIADLVDAKGFPQWFNTNFRKYAGHADQLPVDAHELIALIAPRPVYVTGAQDDRWADPKGEFLACVAAGRVYELLGKRGLETDIMPAVNKPIMQTIAYHVRSGKHTVTDFDWDQFLVFADRYLRGR